MLSILVALIIILLWCIFKFCNYFIECLRSKHALHGIKMNDFILSTAGGKTHGFNRGMKAKKLFAIIGQ